MNAQVVRPAARRDKSPSLHEEAVEEAWHDWLKARQRAMTSHSLSAGIAAGRAWGSFLRLFEQR